MVERLHRQLKTALRAAAPTKWTDALPLVLLGLRTSLKQDLGCSTAELVYGTPLRLPGELVASAQNAPPSTPASFAAELRRTMQALRPTAPRLATRQAYVPRDLDAATHVFVRHDAVKPPLAPPYDGPFRVIARGAKTVTIDRGQRRDVISLDRVKPAYLDAASQTAAPPAPLLGRRSPGYRSQHTAPELLLHRPEQDDPPMVINRQSALVPAATSSAITSDTRPTANRGWADTSGTRPADSRSCAAARS